MRSLVRRLTVLLFILYLFAVIWPGATLFSAAEPMILGLPLSLAWPVGWILLGWIALLVLDTFESGDKDS